MAVYWGAANTNLGMLDKVQQSTISLLDNPEPSLLPCPLERRREAAVVGLLVKVLDGEGRGQVNELKPERIDPSQKEISTTCCCKGSITSPPAEANPCSQQQLSGDLQKKLGSKSSSSLEQPRL